MSKFLRNPLLKTDGYKLGHKAFYPEGTEGVYATWIPRDNRYFKGANNVLFFGLQYFIKEYLIKNFNEDFFNRDVEELVSEWNEFILSYLGSKTNIVGENEIRSLHKLGYLPIEIRALPEGTLSPIGVPQLTIVNTHPDFGWLPNYLESAMSSSLFLPSTSATSAYLYRKELNRHAKKTGFEKDFLAFNMHDFSMRGMAMSEAALVSGMAHLAVFCGSETLSSIVGVRDYYNADYTKELVAGTVPATEHSVMEAAMADGFDSKTELENYKRILTEVFPTSPFVSIVSDTRDYEDVVINIIPQLKNVILGRPGRLVVRPDSGEPVDIIAGILPEDSLYENASEFYRKGTYETLWDIFGGTINDKGYKVLDPHIGIIYGDSITLGRQKEIYRRLEAKGFAATNLVLGIGSFTYQYISRDTLGYALKTTAVKINGEWKAVFKDPKTYGQNMNKKSLKGFVRVDKLKGTLVTTQEVSYDEQGGLLRPVFKDGVLLVDDTLSEIRARIDENLLGE